MKNLNFLSKSSSQSCGHSSVTLALTVGSPSAHRRGIMLKLISVLVLILTIGVGQMWGADVPLTSTFTDKYRAVGDGEPEWDGPDGENGFDNTYGIMYSTTKNSGRTVVLTSSDFTGKKIKKVSVVVRRNKSYAITLAVKVGSTTLGSGDSGANNSQATLSTSSSTGITGGNVEITLSTGAPNKTPGSLYVKSITVEYEPSCNPLTMSTVTATPGNAQIALSWPAVTNASSYTVSCKVKSSGAAAGTAGSVTGTTTKSCTITGLSNGVEYTWSVEPVGSGTYCSSNTPATGDATPNQTRTITYYDKDGSHTTTLADGTNIATALNALYGVGVPTSCNTTDYNYFVGWKDGEISGTATSITLLSTEVVNATTAAKSYYAVWSDTNPSDAGGWEKASAIAVNDVIVLAYESGGTKKELTSIGLISSNSCGIVSDFSTSVSGTFPLTVVGGNSENSFALKNGDDYLSWSSGNTLTTGTEVDNASSWTISISDEVATITNVGTTARRMKYNTGSPRICCYDNNNSDNVTIYKQLSVTANYITTCCTELGQINGLVSLTNEDCEAGELKATWKTSSTGLDGIASQTVKVYRADNNNEVTGLTGLTGKTAQTTNQTVTISGLTPCVEYYVKIWNVSKDGSYCESDFAGEKSSNVTAASYTITKTGVTNVTAESLSAISATTCASGFNTTIVAASGYDLPSTITVIGASHTWNQATGALTISNVTGNVVITITPTEAQCTPLTAPSVSVSGKDYPYDAVTLSWTAVEHADGYTVEIYDGETKIEGDDLDGGADSYTITTTLAANKTYTYKVKATSETPATYCESNWATDNFTTNDYPAATLTLHDANGSSDFTGSHKLFDVVELPSTAAACSKTFMGWSADENRSTAPEFAKGANYTLNEISQDLYAVYADITGGGTSTTNIAYTGSTTATLEDGENEADVFGLDESDWSVISHKHSANTVGVNKEGTIRLYYNAGGNTSLEIIAPQTITSVGVTCKAGNDNIIVKVGNNAITLEDGVYTINATSFEIVNGYTTSAQVHIQNIAVNFTTPGVASNYTTTCAATPVAEASPTNLNNIEAAGASGTITMSYEHVNTANVAVALYSDEACTEAFSGEWLTASLNGDKNITYNIAANTSYNNARSAYIKLTAPETSGTTDPAVVVIPVSQAKKPAVFASLAELVAADVNANTNVTVSFENVPIKEIYYYNSNRRGLTFNIQKADADIKIYFNADVPAAWVAGGKVSATLTDCPWKTYQGEWQLAPSTGFVWDEDLTYTAPPAIESIEIRGAASKKTYIDGQTFDHTGLTAIAIYDNSDEEDVTSYATWTYNPAKLSEGDTEVEVSAEYLGHSDSETVTGLTVNPIPNKTIAEFIAAGGTRCYLEGIVSNITNTTYGNFTLTDETSMAVYGCLTPEGQSAKFNTLGVSAGDKVKVIAETYDNTNSRAVNVVYVSKVSPVAITITDAGSLSVEKGLTLTISATTEPAAAVENITYNVKAGSEDYASVEGNVVTGKAKGTATIIASIPAGEGYLANSVEFEVDVVEYFSITYEENGGSTVADVAKALALPNPLPETTKENYTFNCWFTTSTFDAETEAVAGATLTGNVTLYAKWTEIPVWARTYGSNVTLVGGGTSHEDANVVINAESYPAEKAGASNKTGTVSITVPAGTNAVHFHGFAWSGKSVTVGVEASPAVTNLSASSFALAGDAAGSGSGTYTINSNPVNHYNFFTFDAVEEATTFTFSKTDGSDNRFIIYGVNAIYPEITLSPASYDFENVRANATKEQVFTISANENVSGTLSASIIEDANNKYSVSVIEDNKVTVTFDPNGAESGTFTAKLKITASNASVTADLSGTAIAALAPEITVDKNTIAFGQVDPNASVREDIQIGLLNIEGAVSAALSGDDAAKFALSATSFTEDGVLTITPNTTENGIFEATLTLSATGADDVVLPITMTVASKWAAMYTSNLTPVGTSMESKKVNINSTNYNAYKKAKAENATITLPKGTQKLHLHVVAWNGESGDVTISGSCFNSDKIINVPANDVVSGTTGTYTFTDAEALSYYHEIAIDNEIGTGGINVTVSKSGSRIVLFGVNQEGGTYEIEDDANISTLPENANIEVKENVTLTVDAESTLNNLIVENGGKVTLSSNKLTVVGTFTIETTMASGNSGQLNGATESNFEAGEAYIDITLGAGGTNQQWHAFTVPFPVDAMNGIYDLDGNKLTNEVNYAIMDYHGDIRATGDYGWKKYRGVLVPGTFYIMATDGYRTTYRFKKTANSALVASNSKTIYEYAASGDGQATDAGWNGIGNPNLFYGKVNLAVQVLDPMSYTFVTKTAQSTNFVVGTPFFYQATANGSMEMETANAGGNYAPARERAIEIKDVPVSFGNEDFNDYLYVTANEDALNTYETGKDLVKMTMTNTPKVAQIFGKAYNTKLCMVHAPMVNDQAEVALELYAPQAGTYTISVPTEREDATLYLTYEGNIIWDLTVSPYEAEFEKGQNNDYGLLLVRKAPQVTTGVETIDNSQSTIHNCQKVILNDHVYILRDAQLYDVTGKAVK